ncbi:MAG: DnaJ domain-containing protein [Capsulimonadaceae bacterium]|nr:DnaJ domain-containing protein [Capsulimonadaceae bacterium]
MRLKRNYYEVMGLPRGATATEIKHRYHDLARQFHPDRAQDKELAQRLFSQINLAYRTLANASDRARYDDSLDLDAPAPIHAHAGWSADSSQTAAAPGGGFVHVAARPGPAVGRSAPTGPMPTRQTPTGPMAARPTPTSPLDGAGKPRVTIAQLLEQARALYARGDRDRAMAACRRILSAAPENFEALVLSGDIHADNFRSADAISAYQRALKAQPGNRTLEDRIRRLQASPMPSRSGPSKSTPAPKPQEKLNIFQRIIGGTR